MDPKDPEREIEVVPLKEPVPSREEPDTSPTPEEPAKQPVPEPEPVEA